MNRVGMGGHQWGPIYLLIRIPLQALLIGWTWWFAVRPGATIPIRFSCEATLELPPETIAGQILDLDRWPDFAGYGVLPERAIHFLRCTIASFTPRQEAAIDSGRFTALLRAAVVGPPLTAGRCGGDLAASARFTGLLVVRLQPGGTRR